ncbi:MAG: hypothetical protein Kow0077_06280 [Anaerolineae bacterium]
MQNWQLSNGDPLALILAADARLFHTEPDDDQVWELVLGNEQRPAVALETRYGGRCGLMRIVPMFVVDGQVIYTGAEYAASPVVEAFAPNMARLKLQPTPALAVDAEFLAITSHVIGGRFTLTNRSDALLEAGLDLFPQVMTERREGDVNLLTLEDGLYALHLQQVGNLNPVLMMHGVQRSSKPSPKLAARLTIAPGDSAVIRWVHAARPTMKASLALAYHWLYREDWDSLLAKIETLAQRVPDVRTGDRDRDAVLAFSLQTALRSFGGAFTDQSRPAPVPVRMPERGFTPPAGAEDGSARDMHRQIWDAVLLALSVAPAAPDFAEALLQEALDQDAPFIAPPVLATLAWKLYTLTGRKAWLGQVLEALQRHFARWFAPELDADGDGLPEWQDVTQTGIQHHPLFSLFAPHAQHVNIRAAETPQLAALLIREGRSLLAIGRALGIDAEQLNSVQARVRTLRGHLDAMWRAEAGAFGYRDRDTHAMGNGGQLVVEGAADVPLLVEKALDTPSRLVVEVQGGRDHRPARLEVVLEGVGPDGRPLVETLDGDRFTWYRNRGVATSEHVFGALQRVVTSGLSRVYAVAVRGVDWTVQDVTTLLPLWAFSPDDSRIARLIDTLTDPKRYWLPHGVPVCPADSAAFRAAEQAMGAVMPLWQVLLGDALLDSGRPDLAGELVQRLLAVQVTVLKAKRGFFEAYASRAPEGFGPRGHVAGIAPLSLLWRMMGLTVLSPSCVAITGAYTLPWPVTLRQYGVTVERDAQGAKIVFPSGTVKRIRSDRRRVIVDPAVEHPVRTAPPMPPATPAPGPRPARRDSTGRTIRVPVRRDGTDEAG